MPCWPKFPTGCCARFPFSKSAFFFWMKRSSQFRVHSLSQRPGRPPKAGSAAPGSEFSGAIGRETIFVFRTAQTPARYCFGELAGVRSRNHCRTRFHLLRRLQIAQSHDCVLRRQPYDRRRFLSTDDIDLLITLSNYVAIAIENSQPLQFAAAQGRRV